MNENKGTIMTRDNDTRGITITKGRPTKGKAGNTWIWYSLVLHNFSTLDRPQVNESAQSI